MDMFKQKRNYIITIVVLVIINIACLFLLWLGKPKHDMQGTRGGVDEKVRIQEMLKEELGFSNEQTEQFLTLRESHREKSDKFDDEMKLIKKEMLDAAMNSDNLTISDSLLSLSLEKQGELEKLRFQHFLKIKQICSPNQQEKLIKMIHGLLGPPRRMNPPPGEMPDGRPPRGEFREGHPPPPENHPPRRN